MFTFSLFFPRYLSLLLLSCSSLLSTPSLFVLPSDPLCLSPSLSLCLPSLALPQPVAQLQQCLPGKSWLWYPWKTSQRAASREGGGGGGEHLTQHIYSTVDILVAYFERRRLPLYYIFLTVDRKSPTSSPGCSHTSLWHGPSSESFAPPRRQFLSLIQVEFQLERQHQPTLLCLLSRHNSYSFKLVSLRASPEGPASGTGTTALGNV